MAFPIHGILVLLFYFVILSFFCHSELLLSFRASFVIPSAAEESDVTVKVAQDSSASVGMTKEGRNDKGRSERQRKVGMTKE